MRALSCIRTSPSIPSEFGQRSISEFVRHRPQVLRAKGFSEFEKAHTGINETVIGTTTLLIACRAMLTNRVGFDAAAGVAGADTGTGAGEEDSTGASAAAAGLQSETVSSIGLPAAMASLSFPTT